MHKQIKILIIINSIFLLAANAFAPLYAVFVQGITDKVYHVGAIWGVFIFSAGVFIFIFSRYENNLKYANYFLIGGFIIRAIGWSAYIFASTLTHLYSIQIILAVGAAMGSPSYSSLYTRYLTKKHYASDWGIDLSIGAIIAGIAAFSGGIIVDRFGFDLLLIAMVVLSLLSAVVAFIHRKELGSKNLKINFNYFIPRPHISDINVVKRNPKLSGQELH
ncbi:MAG: MFS transporter [Nanoarchaeota archaeon]